MEIFLSFVIVILFLYNYYLSNQNLFFQSKNRTLCLDNEILKSKLYISTMERLLSNQNLNLSPRAKQLIILATQNNNEFEAKNAALNACKLIAKDLK